MSETKIDPVTQAIREILRGGHPDWIVVPRDYLERLAQKHKIDIKQLYITPLKGADENLEQLPKEEK